MKLLNLIVIALRAMSRNKMRTFLTMLGIIIGVASVISMLAIGQGSKESIERQISDMGANMINIFPSSGQQGGVRMDASSMQLLTVKDAENIKAKAKYVAGVSPLVSGSGQAVAGANNWPTSIQGVGEDFLEIRKLKLAEGSVFSDHDVKVAAKVCIIGKTVVTNLFPNDPHQGVAGGAPHRRMSPLFNHEAVQEVGERKRAEVWLSPNHPRAYLQ